MCGIAGVFYKNGGTVKAPDAKVLQLLRHRGPDFQAHESKDNCTLYHARLSIIDTSTASNQPFCDEAKEHLLAFNGEIFNYKDLGSQFGKLHTSGDVEVLFESLKTKGKHCLDLLNGFFAFGFYDSKKESLLVARDRFGVKPLYYYNDENTFAFASELKPLLQIVGKQDIDPEQLYTYFRLNYCSGPGSIFKNIYRLLPGQLIEVSKNEISIETWYKAPQINNQNSLAALLNDAVKLRLQSDVPLGTFLSGGIDSSVISALAIKHKPDLNTFSIGFEKETFFDETRYSELVARHIGSKHHVFKLNEEDFLNHIDPFLNNIDEPFADSSAFNFYVLSELTRKHVTVALSGDGADELFKGYNKHRALMLSESAGNRFFARAAAFVAGRGSRDGKLNNKLRQLKKFATLAGLSETEKQKFLASISTGDDCHRLLKYNFSETYFDSLFETYKSFERFSFEDTFDIHTVLADDMLVKADRFSMQHGLEIRNPFLDYRVVEFALNLSKNEKINSKGQKLILRKEFEGLLPPEIFSRSKKGFELPLQKWLSGPLKSKIENTLLSRERIEDEKILNWPRVKQIMDSAFSDNPGDDAAKLWALVVFQGWRASLEF